MSSENDSNANSLQSYRWSQETNRKRKMNFDDKLNRKRFLTEEKMIKDLQALSLDLTFSKTTDQKHEEENDDDDQPCLRFHHVLEDNLKRDPFQDGLIEKLYNLECKRISMQIVPYMPIHPGQLQSTTFDLVNKSDKQMKDDDEHERAEEKLSPLPVPRTSIQKDEPFFKRPFAPPPYTVEEPCETPIEHSQRMKRSYSQSLRSNSNLIVVELKKDETGSSGVCSNDDYFVVEPCTPIAFDSCEKKSQSNTATTYPPIRITEYFDFFPSTCSDRERLTRLDLPSETSEMMEADIDS